jgi:hypothetical protein
MSDDELIRLARPKARADCKDAARPCPFLSCRHHLADVVVGPNGRLRLGVLDMELEVDATREDAEAYTDLAADAVVAMRESCALDVIDRERDACTLQVVGNALNLTRERIRQIERRTLREAEPRVRRALNHDRDERRRDR